MRSVEVSAKTREEAIKIALEQLGVDRDEAYVEILDEGSSGIFGFAARPVKLRVATEVKGPPIPSRPKPQSGSRSRSREKAPKASRPSGSTKSGGRERSASDAGSAGDGEAAALLQEVIRRMGIEATVTSQASEDGGICLKVDSPDSAILIGRKGRNLSSMQYLINRMVQSGESGEDTERLVIDVEGYLDRRQEALEDLARRLAQRAKETRRRVRVKPMSPQERRIIHMTLEDDPDVKTFSVGDALVRSVVIAPKDEIAEDEQRPARRRSGGRRGGRGRDQGAPSDYAQPRNSGQHQRGGQQRGGRHRGRRRPSGQQQARGDEKALAETDASSGEPGNA